MTFLGQGPSRDELSGIRYVLTDIDDTLTTEGKLLPETYQAMWDLRDQGIELVTVTGGSAGWCEHIVRAWPVAAAIGESGAFVMRLEGGRVETEYWEGEAIQSKRQTVHLATITPLLGDRFRLAHDQRFRLADVAIDIGGHHRSDVDDLARRIRATGAAAAISSVHINTWVGEYDKRTMSERLLRRMGLEDAEVGEQVCFVGDSRNDAPMFAHFPKSFGVANILPVLDDLPMQPRWISQAAAGRGFADIAQAILGR